MEAGPLRRLADSDAVALAVGMFGLFPVAGFRARRCTLLRLGTNLDGTHLDDTTLIRTDQDSMRDQQPLFTRVDSPLCSRSLIDSDVVAPKQRRPFRPRRREGD